MKKFLTLLFIASSFLSACTLKAGSPTTEIPAAVPTQTSTPEPAEPWEIVLELDRVEQNVRMAAFYDDRLGFTGGADSAGKLHITNDGGQTWVVSDTSSG